MVCLRILGRGLCYDDINELSSIPNASIPTYFHTFVRRFAELYIEDDEVDGGGIIEDVEVNSVSLDSRVDLRLLRKVELDALLETLPEVEGVVEK